MPLSNFTDKFYISKDSIGKIKKELTGESFNKYGISPEQRAFIDTLSADERYYLDVYLQKKPHLANNTLKDISETAGKAGQTDALYVSDCLYNSNYNPFAAYRISGKYVDRLHAMPFSEQKQMLGLLREGRVADFRDMFNPSASSIEIAQEASMMRKDNLIDSLDRKYHLNYADKKIITQLSEDNMKDFLGLGKYRFERMKNSYRDAFLEGNVENFSVKKYTAISYFLGHKPLPGPFKKFLAQSDVKISQIEQLQQYFLENDYYGAYEFIKDKLGYDIESDPRFRWLGNRAIGEQRVPLQEEGHSGTVQTTEDDEAGKIGEATGGGDEGHLSLGAMREAYDESIQSNAPTRMSDMDNRLSVLGLSDESELSNIAHKSREMHEELRNLTDIEEYRLNEASLGDPYTGARGADESAPIFESEADGFGDVESALGDLV